MAAEATKGPAEAGEATEEGEEGETAERCGSGSEEDSWDVPSREIGQFDLLALTGVARHAPGGPRPG